MAKDLISPNADAITRLKDFASQLRELEQPTSPISIHLAQYFADAIEDFLSDETGTADTLEAALGFTGQPRKRGRPRKKSKEDTAITERYLSLKFGDSKRTHDEVLSTLTEKGLMDGQEDSTIRRIVDRNWIETSPKLIADELAKELSERSDSDRAQTKDEEGLYERSSPTGDLHKRLKKQPKTPK